MTQRYQLDTAPAMNHTNYNSQKLAIEWL